MVLEVNKIVIFTQAKHHTIYDDKVGVGVITNVYDDGQGNILYDIVQNPGEILEKVNENVGQDRIIAMINNNGNFAPLKDEYNSLTNFEKKTIEHQGNTLYKELNNKNMTQRVSQQDPTPVGNSGFLRSLQSAAKKKVQGVVSKQTHDKTPVGNSGFLRKLQNAAKSKVNSGGSLKRKTKKKKKHRKSKKSKKMRRRRKSKKTRRRRKSKKGRRRK